MAQQTSGHSIEDIYKVVIDDVMSQVKEAFLDENIDIDVLHQLKKEWTDKVNASGAVDMEGPKRMARPEIQANVSRPGQRMNGAQQNPPLIYAPPPPQARIIHVRADQPGHQFGMPESSEGPGKQTQQHQVVVASSSALSQQGSGDTNAVNAQHMRQQVIRVPVQSQNFPINGAGGQQFIVVSQQGQQGNVPGVANLPRGFPSGAVFTAAPAGGVSQPAGQAQAILPQMGFSLPNGQRVTQVQQNGQSFIVANSNGGVPMFLQQNGNMMVAHGAPVRGQDIAIQAMNAHVAARGIIPPGPGPQPNQPNPMQQLDGGGTMTDSSSEDEDEIENDPLQSILNPPIGEDGEVIQEEAPLNSDDDQSDDEDLGTLFDSNNVVMCQFEKVHRARTKWKFHLKDGIMQIQGRDYVFSKCSGEAEW